MRGTPVETPVISLENVTKSYKGGFEFGPVDVTVEPGSVVAVLGPNGGGKSTLFSILMNLIKPDSGRVSLFGGAYPGDEVAIKQRIGYVPERSLGHDDMSARTSGEFVSYWYPTWDQTLYEDLIGRLRIDPEKKFGKLSRGMQRRLSFALALASGPELLLLDEPTDGVDPIARREILEDVWRFARGGAHDGDRRTAVFATHAVEEARRVADHVLFLADGKFLGLHEKDGLIERWKTLWVDGMPEVHIPGVVEVESGSPTRIVSDSWRKTAEDLSAQSVRIFRKERVDLEEILSHLIRQSMSSRRSRT